MLDQERHPPTEGLERPSAARDRATPRAKGNPGAAPAGLFTVACGASISLRRISTIFVMIVGTYSLDPTWGGHVVDSFTVRQYKRDITIWLYLPKVQVRTYNSWINSRIDLL
jgi:hypothetical protein